MSGNLTTKGFNPEDTHPANADKLSALLAVLGLAAAVSVKTGVAAAPRRRPIPIKKRGRRAGSPFVPGLSASRTILAAANPSQASAFPAQLLSPKLPLNSLKSRAR
ncbi:MAG: hypothetical protein WBG11_05530 [Methylocella sp.]